MILTARTESGTVCGVPASDPMIAVFRGIPFAAPPAGELRWRAPVPHPGWHGERDCARSYHIPMQPWPSVGKALYSREFPSAPYLSPCEDCLTLNIWTPSADACEKRPVFIWFFGGGLQKGCAQSADCERMAKRGAVVVAVNYRINVFGFLAHPELSAEAPDAPCNFGHLDQQFALKWVKHNIHAFGGDPEAVTIGGQSAGGLSVLTQITAPSSRGLFNRAIVASGSFTDLFPPSSGSCSLSRAQRQGEEFFKKLGVGSLCEARALDAVYITEKYLEFGQFFSTVTDGVFCSADPLSLIMNGDGSSVPLLAGHTADEFPISENAADAAELIERIAHIDCGFPGDGGSFCAFEPSTRTLLTALSDRGLPCYGYCFDAELPGGDNAGSFHSSDLWFFFETLANCWRPFSGRHYDLAGQMCDYWANFILSGDPNGDGSSPLPKWTAFMREHPDLMCFTDIPTMEKSLSPAYNEAVCGALRDLLDSKARTRDDEPLLWSAFTQHNAV